MLSALIKHGHNYSNSVSLTADSGNCSFKVCIVLVGAHRNLVTVDFVSQAVVEHIGNNENVIASYRLKKCTLTFACSETGERSVDDVGVLFIACESNAVFVLRLLLSTPFNNVAVNFVCELLTAGQCDYA